MIMPWRRPNLPFLSEPLPEPIADLVITVLIVLAGGASPARAVTLRVRAGNAHSAGGPRPSPLSRRSLRVVLAHDLPHHGPRLLQIRFSAAAPRPCFCPRLNLSTVSLYRASMLQVARGCWS